MGEGEGRSPSEGACVKVAAREGASLIPRASYQTVSRLQQLLSAQNTQALPFQLKGSLTKSREEKKKKKYPASGELVSLQHKGLFGGPSVTPRSPQTPAPCALRGGGVTGASPGPQSLGVAAGPAAALGPFAAFWVFFGAVWVPGCRDWGWGGRCPRWVPEVCCCGRASSPALLV